jgi:hypothetical protein
MNGQKAKLLRKVFDPTESPEKRREYRRFKKTYVSQPPNKKAEVIKVASKIKEFRNSGKEVKSFRIDESTRQMIPEEGGVDERPTNDSDNARSAGHREGDNAEESK